jgi:hypothetical protein
VRSITSADQERIMRRKSLATLGILTLTGLAATLTGCASDQQHAAVSTPSTQAEPAAAPKPRRNRLCSGDALGNKILRTDPSLSAAGAYGNDFAAVETQ